MTLQDILQKFELLPLEKKKFLSSPMVLVALEEIELKYQLKLALVLMELVIDDNYSNNLPALLEQKLSLTSVVASSLAQDLRSKILDEYQKIKIENEKKAEFVGTSQSDNISSIRQSFNKESQVTNILMPPPPMVIKQVKKTKFIQPEIISTDDIFDEDDKQEVKKFETRSKDIESYATAIDWNSKAKRIINSLNINLSDDVLDNRLIIIVINALKGVRKIIDTRNILTKRVVDGGVGLNTNLAENILSAIKSTKIAIDEEQLEKGENKYKFLLSRDSEPLIKEEQSRKTRLEKYIASNKPGLINIEEEPESIDITKNQAPVIDDKIEEKEPHKMLMPPLPVIIPQNNRIKPPIPQPVKKDLEKSLSSIEDKKEVEVGTKILSDNNISINDIFINNEAVKAKEPVQRLEPELLPKITPPIISPKLNTPILKTEIKQEKKGFFSRLFARFFGKKEKEIPIPVKNNKKIILEDIKKVEVSPIKENGGHKLIGPIEELEDLTLNDFRNLSPDPVLAINKIEEKIKNLEMDSLAKKILGIKAWKKGEVNTLYLAILNEAMINHKTFADIIKERQNRRISTLSNEEFEVVSDFSKKIRF